MYDQSLGSKFLPAELIIKNFVRGEERSNYEIYLLELVNHCPFFLKKSKGVPFVAPPSEAHGEYDCNSESYKFDFKLMASKTMLQARSIFSQSISLISEGAIAKSVSKAKGKMEATRIHAALRNCNYEQLLQIRKEAPKRQGIENDIFEVLTTLETKKNLLLYFPHYFSFATEYSFDDGIAQIIEALDSGFQEAWHYRNEHALSLDTYFAFLYDKHIVFCQLVGNGLRRVGAVKLTESPIFCRLNNYGTPIGVDIY